MQALIIFSSSAWRRRSSAAPRAAPFFIWFIIGFVLPVIGLLTVLFYRTEADEPERRCPRCGRVHKLYVQVCRGCGEDMYLPDPSEVRHPRAVREGRQRIAP